MNIREYNEDKDYHLIHEWLKDSKIHALWSAYTIPYPMTKENLREALQAKYNNCGDKAYVYVDEQDHAIGFFVYSLHQDNKKVYLKHIVVDDQQRGKGYGSSMLKSVIEHAREEGAVAVKLSVFDCNTGAKKCYEKVGFIAYDFAPDALQYENESWGRCLMEATINTEKFF